MISLKPKGTKLQELDADPAKTFFVDMLTRDLSLQDAILDLLDNCVDGALRMNRLKKGKKDQFAGCWAEIVINEKSFTITDNCGGIPEDKLKYAFMHGRPASRSDEGIATVGVYGIGMKRAIYKLGNEAKVITQSGNLLVEVPFTKAWMESDIWKLPLHGSRAVFKSDGTKVEVTGLRPEVQNIFSIGLKDFVEKLHTLIGQHYAYIIDHGFTVKINGKKVEGKPINLLFQFKEGNSTLRPYFWENEIDGVKIFLAVGFYSPPPSKKQVEDEESESENWQSDHSGWTVMCNHRVVAYCDKSFLTGWGDRPIPRFHTQFNAIRGLVTFECDDASKLPTTTTKRGLDTGKSLYAEVKNVMKDGLRMFIDSTNAWKGETDKSREMLQSEEVTPLGLEELKQKAGSLMKPNKGSSGGLISKPKLPVPDRPEKPVWMRFAKSPGEVKAVASYLFGDDRKKPGLVAEACFDYLLKKSR